MKTLSEGQMRSKERRLDAGVLLSPVMGESSPSISTNQKACFEKLTYDQMHEVAQYLYQLLDDIDTMTDMAKSDDTFYRHAVAKIQSKKSAVVAECDGYIVTFKSVCK